MSFKDPVFNTSNEFQKPYSAFTLIELVLTMALVAVVITPLCLLARDAGNVTNAVNEIANLLEAAASYSRVNNTWVWVGFCEEDATAESTGPSQPGTGRIVVSVVASKDGTRVADWNGHGTEIDPGRLVQIFKLSKFENMHLSDVPAPAQPDAAGGGISWETRPNVKPYKQAYKIGDTTPVATSFPFVYPVGIPRAPARYNFLKTIQFRPNGEAILNTSYSLVPWIEIGLQPARGNLRDDNSANLAAIQVSGITGNVKIYRR